MKIFKTFIFILFLGIYFFLSQKLNFLELNIFTKSEIASIFTYNKFYSLILYFFILTILSALTTFFIFRKDTRAEVIFPDEERKVKVPIKKSKKKPVSLKDIVAPSKIEKL